MLTFSNTETLLDILELYTHHRNATTVGPDFSLDTFLNIRIPLNQEADSKKLPRYAYFNKRKPETNGVKATNGSKRDGDKNNKNATVKDIPRVNPLAPTAAHDPGQRSNEKGRESTIRFMLNQEQAKAEKSTVEQYFKVEMEQYEVEE